MEFAARALLADQPSAIVDSCVERANKCSRTFVAQVEALNRLRGQSQQKVVVKHVTVNPGGQAVVGNVNHQGGGGRVPDKTEVRPHAPREIYALRNGNAPGDPN